MQREYGIGNQVVQCDFLYDGMLNASKDYLINESHLPDIIISYSKYEIEQCATAHKGLDFNQCERIYSMEKYALEAANHWRLLLHAAAIVIDRKVVLFCGNGSIGKTTQVRLWKNTFAANCEILSDDRPVIGYKNNKVCAWNTPWSKFQNRHIPNNGLEIAAICFLEQCNTTKVQLLNSVHARQLCLNLYPKSLQYKISPITDSLFDDVSCFLFCNDASLDSIECLHKEIKLRT